MPKITNEGDWEKRIAKEIEDKQEEAEVQRRLWVERENGRSYATLPALIKPRLTRLMMYQKTILA